MCKLCEQANRIEDECGYGAYWIENGNKLRAVADDPYCGTGPLTINYCPICGKKLEHKET